MTIPSERQILTIAILRIVGYGLLMMALVDLINIVIPLKLMNPNWEFETVGAIIDRIPVTFLGIAFVFYEDTAYRTPIEKFLLKIISWSCLIFALFLLLVIPLNINNSFRIYNQHNANINAQLAPRLEVVQDFESRLKNAKSKENIEEILQKQSQAKIKIPDSLNIQELKASIQKNLQKEQDSLQSQAQKSRKEKQIQLLRQAVKYNLGALISIFLLIFVWKNTFWARTDYSWE